MSCTLGHGGDCSRCEGWSVRKCELFQMWGLKCEKVWIVPGVGAEVWKSMNCSRCGGWSVKEHELFQMWGLKCEKAWIVQMWGLKCEKVWIVPDMGAEVWKCVNCSRCGGWSVKKHELFQMWGLKREKVWKTWGLWCKCWSFEHAYVWQRAERAGKIVKGKPV